MERIQEGQFAQVHYTGKLDDGTVFDSSEGRQPLEFKVGSGQVIPGFDQAIQGMEVNEEKNFTLTSEEAYGPVRDDLKKDFPKDMLGEKEVDVGQELWFKTPQGPVPGRVLNRHLYRGLQPSPGRPGSGILRQARGHQRFSHPSPAGGMLLLDSGRHLWPLIHIGKQ